METMKRLIAFTMLSFRATGSFSKMLKKQIQGFAYLLFHPYRLKRIIIREVRYGQRYRNKQSWLEWQAYDQYIAHLQHDTPESQVRPLTIARIQTISDMVSSVGKGLQVLDVGCGYGEISGHLFKMGYQMACADLPTITSLTHQRRGLLVVASDAEQLAFASNSFDVVLISSVMEHLWYPKVFLNEAYRILRDGGHLIIEVPEGEEGLRWDSHIQYFTLEGLKELLGTRFRVCQVKRLKPVVGVPTPTLIIMSRKLNDEA